MTIFFLFLWDTFFGDYKMNVKIFDFEHEVDLEEAINDFLADEKVEMVNIFYQTSHFYAGNEQLFSFSAMILYKNKEK